MTEQKKTTDNRKPVPTSEEPKSAMPFLIALGLLFLAALIYGALT